MDSYSHRADNSWKNESFVSYFKYVFSHNYVSSIFVGSLTLINYINKLNKHSS